MLGLSYKPHTPVIEELQGIMLAKALADAGIEVVAHDPMALGPAQAVLGDTAKLVPSAQEAVSQADVVVIVTPWPEYADDFVRMGSERQNPVHHRLLACSSIRLNSQSIAKSSAWGIRRRFRLPQSVWLRNE